MKIMKGKEDVMCVQLGMTLDGFIIILLSLRTTSLGDEIKKRH